MESKLSYYLSDVLINVDVLSNRAIHDVQQTLDFRLPEDYIDLIRAYNGCEGSIGKNSWLFLFPLEELVAINHDYRLLMNQITGYFLFGKDAADTGYAFHKQMQTFHSFGLMSNFRTDPIEFCGNTITEFIEYLYNR